MKIYQIAGKEYAVSGDNLYEKVPEFSPLQQLIKDIDESESTSTFALKKKVPKVKAKRQARTYVTKKGYKRGTCGKCGKEGHSAWHCPEGPQKKGAAKGFKAKDARAKKVLDRAAAKPRSKYDPDEIVTLARRVSNKGMSAQEAADKLGVTVGMWYYLRKKFAGDVVPKQSAEEKPILTPDEIHEQVIEMQNMGLTSLVIAQKLKIPLSMVNKYWQKDVLAPPTAEDIPETEDEIT
jgi:hypothetical protein